MPRALDVQLLFFVYAIRDKSRFLETLFGQSDIAIVIDDSPQQSVLGGVVQYELKFNFLAYVVHIFEAFS